MLEIRPICENCGKPLPPEAADARICSFECTFCQACVDSVLHNVCPNCGGGFTPRPVRPSRNWKDENCLDKYPAGRTPKHRPVDPVAHDAFAAPIRKVPPDRR